VGKLFRLARKSGRGYGLALALAAGATIATSGGVAFAATPTDIAKFCTAAGGTQEQINTCIWKATIDASRRGYDGTVASARAFRASVGVNVPDTWWNTPYGQWDKVLQALKTAGITHIRSGFSANPANDNGWNQYLYQLINQAQAQGIYFMVGFEGPINAYPGYTSDFISRIKTKINPWMVDAIEYPNEYDWNGTDANWATDLTPWAESFVKAWRADPTLKSKPVVGPALVQSSSVTTLAKQGLGGYVDVGNIHPYCGATTPTRTHDLNEFSRMKPLTGSDPIWASEAGTHTAMNAPPGSGMPPAPESVQAVYTLREYLQHYHDGIGRTYIYHLIDMWPDPDRTHPAWNWGLIHTDFTPKPAFTALTNLNALIGSGVPTVLGPLEHTVSGDVKGDLQHMVIERGDGSYDVVLWRQAEIYNRDTKTILSVPAETITVGLPKAKSVTAGDPLKEATGHPLTLNGSVQVDVGADPIVLHVTQ
jgi:Cellulase (glycosyl hydrolase family 5)